jgi:uncharacterized membrane protein YwzB
MALLIAVWWAIQPLNYDTLNEVHLFSLLPVLIAGIVARAGLTAHARGGVA